MNVILVSFSVTLSKCFPVELFINSAFIRSHLEQFFLKPVFEVRRKSIKIAYGGIVCRPQLTSSFTEKKTLLF